MNGKKFCFIFCTNNRQLEEECMYYIQRLTIPKGYEIEIQPIYGAKSMCEGYNRGMKNSDAKYKIYLHQDTFIVDIKYLFHLLEIFQNDEIGMIGMVGSRYLPKTLEMWDGSRVGKVESHLSYYYNSWYGHDDGRESYTEVQCVDGFMMATQYDLPWREDLFHAWHFYDISQSFEFRRKGYKVVVPYMEKAWCFHYSELMNLTKYDSEKEVFRKEYENNLQKKGDVIVIYWGVGESGKYNAELYELALYWKSEGRRVIIYDIERFLNMTEHEIISEIEDIYGKYHVLFSVGTYDTYNKLGILKYYKDEICVVYHDNKPFLDYKILIEYPENYIYCSSNVNHVNFVKNYYPNIKKIIQIPNMSTYDDYDWNNEEYHTWDVLWQADYVDADILFEKYLQQFEDGLKEIVIQLRNTMIEDFLLSLEQAIHIVLEKNHVQMSKEEYRDLCVAFSMVEDNVKQKYIEKLADYLVENEISVHIVGNGWEEYPNIGKGNLHICASSNDIRFYGLKSNIIINSSVLMGERYYDNLIRSYQCGAISVTEDLGEKKNILTDKEAVFINPNKLDGLSNQMKQILKDHQTCREMNRRGKKRVKEYFTIKKIADGIEEAMRTYNYLKLEDRIQGKKGEIICWGSRLEQNNNGKKLLYKYINSEDEKIIENIRSMLQTYQLSAYNEKFIYPYIIPKANSIYYDSKKQMRYVLFQDKRMYYPRKMEEQEISSVYRMCCLEQDPHSPHYYYKTGYEVKDGDIVIEAGVAEGNFALSIIDKVSKIYLVECEEKWVEALKCTFEPYKDKVVIVSKYLSDSDEDGNITIDTLLDGQEVNFIKMDIEGAELSALKGARETFARSKQLRCAICTYHRHGDEENIRQYLEENGMFCENSEGYMFFNQYDKEGEEPEFRRGLMFGKKEK